jgi:hypothetical protein
MKLSTAWKLCGRISNGFPKKVLKLLSNEYVHVGSGSVEKVRRKGKRCMVRCNRKKPTEKY